MSTRDSALAWPPGEVSEIDRIASQLALVATTVDQTVVAEARLPFRARERFMEMLEATAQ